MGIVELDSRTGRRFSYAHTTRPKPVLVYKQYAYYIVWKPDSRGCSKVVRPSITSSCTLIVNELLYSIFVIVVVFTCCDWLYGALGQSRVKIERDHRDRKYYNNAAVVMYNQVVLYYTQLCWFDVEVWKPFIRSTITRAF